MRPMGSLGPLLAALLAGGAALGAAGHAAGGGDFVCTHDAVSTDAGEAPQAYHPEFLRRRRGGSAVPCVNCAPIRIHYDYSYFDPLVAVGNRDAKTCYEVGQQVVIGSVDSTDIACNAEINVVNNCYIICTVDQVLTSAKVAFVRDHIMPSADDFLTSALAVEPLADNLRVPTPFCSINGDAVSISSHYGQSGSGQPNTDIVVLVMARPTVGTVLAYATHCHRDSVTARPIFGILNFGMSAISPVEEDYNIAQVTTVAIHEVTHILGFSSSLYPVYRNQPVTAPLAFPNSDPEYNVTIVVTPTVRAFVRDYFGCDTLRGAPLEDGGGGGTAGAHWEKRLFRNEFMTGTSSVDPALTALTLALLQDTGWYETSTDVEGLSEMTWGRGLGCDFVLEKCNEWDTIDPDYLCDETANGCMPSGLSKGVCGVVNYDLPLPEEFRYFPEPSRGGLDFVMDYCPVYLPRCLCTDGDSCSGTGDAFTNYAEVFGSSSRCVWHQLFRDVASEDVVPNESAGCYPHACRGPADVLVSINGVWHECAGRAGEDIDVYDGLGYTGTFRCPDPSLCANAEVDLSWPAIESVSPTSGSTSGGTGLTLVGANFVGDIEVEIGTIPCTDVVVVDDRTISARLGENSALTGDARVSVVVRSEGRTATLPGGFTYEQVNPLLEGALDIWSQVKEEFNKLNNKYSWFLPVVIVGLTLCCLSCCYCCRRTRVRKAKKSLRPAGARYVENYGNFAVGLDQDVELSQTRRYRD